MRKSLVAISLLLGSVLSGAGCGSAAPTLTCSYLEGDNCWKTTAEQATSCLPASTEIGALSADGKTCTYARGDVVTFTPALALPLPGGTANIPWNFTVTTGSGAACLSYVQDANNDMTLTVGDQTVKESAGGIGLTLTCPGGMVYSNSNALALFSCPDADIFSAFPGNTWSGTSTSVSFGLLGTAGSYGSEPVFNCEMAP